MRTDAALLLDAPDYLSIEVMLKATPAAEGSNRFIYFEASNEGRDQQGEVVLAKALADSQDHYLKFGNVDIDHYSLIGKPNPAKGWAGLPNPEQYEIGRPVQVRVDGKQTFVKAQLYSGDGVMAANANMVWDSMTKLNPPKRWYPSVGGAVLSKSLRLDAKTGEKTAVVDRVRWTNVALSQNPVNQHISGPAQTVPFGALTKSMTGGAIDWAKALTAGYGTDSAALTGGSALRMQSLDRRVRSYFDFREAVSQAMRAGRLKSTGAEGMQAYGVKEFGLSHDEAAEYVERFVRDVHSALKGRKGGS